MKIYVTFGQVHVHKVGKDVFDCDSIAEIECESENHGRAIAMQYFKGQFFTHYLEDQLGNLLPYAPRGVIKLDVGS